LTNRGEDQLMTDNDQAARAFARRLRDDHAFERVLLYGAFKRDFASTVWEYRLILVSSGFQGVDLSDRPAGLHDIYYEVGGTGALALICLTPEEFEQAKGRITLVREVLPEAIDLLAEEPASA
jgi:hypothetical protein